MLGVAKTTRQSNSDGTEVKISPLAIRNLIYCEKWAEIESACECNPYQVEVVDKLGDLPLHEACLQAAPFHIIQILVSTYPAGVKKKGFCGRLPIHYASYVSPSVNVIKLLLQNHPKGVSTKDSDGRLPLHLAVVRNAPTDAIQALILAYPNSINIRNNFGSTPQMLARNEHIQSLLQEDAARLRNTVQKKKVATAGITLKSIASKNEGKRQPVNKKKKNSDRSNFKRNTLDKFFSNAEANLPNNDWKSITPGGDRARIRIGNKKVTKITIHQRSQIFSPRTSISTPSRSKRSSFLLMKATS